MKVLHQLLEHQKHFHHLRTSFPNFGKSEAQIPQYRRRDFFLFCSICFSINSAITHAYYYVAIMF